MTKEQEKAIEMLEDIENNTWTTKYIMSSDSKKAEIVLNMLKEKDRQINSKNGTINALQSALKERTEERDRKDNIIARQRKQIDLMAKAMDKIQDPQACKYCDNKINLNYGYCLDAGKCKEGIKQYFERKSEE